MEIDTNKVDEAVLALLYLTLHDGARAWKGFDWDTLNRLHAKGFISDPVSKAKSVILTEEGTPRVGTAVHQAFRQALASVAALQASHVALSREHQPPTPCSLRKAIAIAAAPRDAARAKARAAHPVPSAASAENDATARGSECRA